jgi:hypothetical protein
LRLPSSSLPASSPRASSSPPWAQHPSPQGERGRLAILRDLAVHLAIADVGSEAAVQHLHAGSLELLDDAVGRDLFLLADQEQRALEFDGVGIVLGLERGIGTATLGEGTKAPHAHGHLLAVVLAQCARQLEQLQRLFQRNRVQALGWTQGGEARLVLVVLGADLREWPVAPEAHRDRLAGFRIDAEHARAGGFARDRPIRLVVDLGLERHPEARHQRHPVLSPRLTASSSSSSLAVKS